MPRSEKLQPVEWNTADEILFIDGIGRHKGHKPCNIPPNCPHLFHLTREQMLKKYLDYVTLRVFWGSIDENAVTSYAVDALEEERIDHTPF